jgi:chorismate mutase/prephenate dehydratase
MEKPVTSPSLEHIRREIDDVDRAMLELLERRFAAIEAIKAIKGRDSEHARTPMRPAREAEILRRLYRLRQSSVPVQLMVRLWRSIISAATSAQANVAVHIAEDIDTDDHWREMVREYFAGLPVRRQLTARKVIEESVVGPSDIGVVRTESDWIAPLVESKGLRVMGMLPFVAPRNQPPAMLILGRAKAEPSGDDETLIGLAAESIVPEQQLWQAKAGNYKCASLPGFLDEKSPEVVRLKASGQDVLILGRCPCPLETRP